MPVEATLNAYPDWKIPAEVIAIIPAADRGKATVKVRVAIKTEDPRIVPDMGVAVRFLEKRSEEHTSELQSLMRISYAVFCLKKKKQKPQKTHPTQIYAR